MIPRRIIPSMLALFAFAAAGALTPLAVAQGPGDHGMVFRPTVHPAELDRYAEVLSLDDTQTLIAEELLAVYASDFREAAEEVRERIDEIQEEAQSSGNYRLYAQELGPLLEEWGERKNRLEQDLFANLKNLLRDDQLARWETFERERRRHTQLPLARLNGEDVDLIRLVEDFGLEPHVEESLRSLLDRYAQELDLALKQRQDVLPRLEREWREASGDREAMTELWQEATRKRVAVRDTNMRYARMIASRLGGEDEKRFIRQFIREAFPIAYVETGADQMFDAADALDSLADDQRATLEQMRENFETRRDALARELVARISEDQTDIPDFIRNIRPSGSSRRINVVVSTTAKEDPYDGLLNQRDALSESFVSQIRSVLTAEQAAQLPEIEKPRRQRFHDRRFRFNL